MKLHHSVVEKMIYFCTNYGGHQNESKLRSQFENLKLSTHSNSNGDMFLVETQVLLTELNNRRMDVSHVIPMSLHPSVIQKIMYTYDMYSGHSNEGKLKSAFRGMDLTPYERMVNGNDVVLVLSQDYIKILQSLGRRGE